MKNSSFQVKKKKVFNFNAGNVWPFFPFVFCQVAYFTEMHNIFTELTDQIDQGGLTDEQRKQENEAKLNELRALSIVADDWDILLPTGLALMF